MQYRNLLTYQFAYSMAYCPGCIQVNTCSSIPAGCRTTVIRTVVVLKYNLLAFFIIICIVKYEYCSTIVWILIFANNGSLSSSYHFVVESISRCVLAFRVRSSPPKKYQVFGVHYSRALHCRTYAIRTHSFGFRMDNSPALYRARLPYLHYVALITAQHTFRS